MKLTAILSALLLAVCLSARSEQMLRVYRGAGTNTVIVAFGCPPGQGAWWDVAAGPVLGATNGVTILQPHPAQINSPVRTYVYSDVPSTNGLFFWPVVRR